MAEQIELTLSQPGAWTPPKAKGKFGCGCDPAAGPGTCYHWWDGCPKAKKRGCYLLWRREHNEMPEASR